MTLIEEIWLTLKGRRKIFKLHDQSYGEWIIELNGTPKYFWNIMGDNELDNKIRTMIQESSATIETIIKKIGRSNDLNLRVHNPKFYGIKIKEQKIETRIVKLPSEFIQNFKKYNCSFCINGNISEFKSIDQFNKLELALTKLINNEKRIKQVNSDNKVEKYNCIICNKNWSLKPPNFPVKGFLKEDIRN